MFDLYSRERFVEVDFSMESILHCCRLFGFVIFELVGWF